MSTTLAKKAKAFSRKVERQHEHEMRTVRHAQFLVFQLSYHWERDDVIDNLAARTGLTTRFVNVWLTEPIELEYHQRLVVAAKDALREVRTGVVDG